MTVLLSSKFSPRKFFFSLIGLTFLLAAFILPHTAVASATGNPEQSGTMNLYHKGSSIGRIDADGTVILHGRSVGRIRTNGDIVVEGRTTGKLESDGTVRKEGRTVGRVNNSGDVTRDGRHAGYVRDNGDVVMDGRTVGRASNMSNRKWVAVIFFFDFFYTL